MNDLNTLGSSLEATAAKDDLKELVSELADNALEKILDATDAIPVLSWVTKGLKGLKAVKDAFFMEKVITFLSSLSEASSTDRQKMIDDINNDENYREKFGKFSLIALERLEDTQKARYLGLAAKYLANGHINYKFYKRFSFIINRLYIDDLNSITSINQPSGQVLTELESLGLLKSKIKLPDTQYLKRNGISSSNGMELKATSITKTIWGVAVRNIIQDLPLNHGQLISTLEQTIDELKRSTAEY